MQYFTCMTGKFPRIKTSLHLIVGFAELSKLSYQEARTHEAN
jgi:hypothetical protein